MHLAASYNESSIQPLFLRVNSHYALNFSLAHDATAKKQFNNLLPVYNGQILQTAWVTYFPKPPEVWHTACFQTNLLCQVLFLLHCDNCVFKQQSCSSRQPFYLPSSHRPFRKHTLNPVHSPLSGIERMQKFGVSLQQNAELTGSKKADYTIS